METSFYTDEALESRELRRGSYSVATTPDVVNLPIGEIAEEIYSEFFQIMSKEEALIWCLFDHLGWTQNDIARYINCSRTSVQNQLRTIKKKLQEHVDGHVLTIFARESQRTGYHNLQQGREPVPADIARAREYIEESGWYTSMPTGTWREIHCISPQGLSLILSPSQVKSLAEGGIIRYNRQHWCIGGLLNATDGTPESGSNRLSTEDDECNKL